MNSFVTLVLFCPLGQIYFYLCHTFLSRGRSMFYASRLAKSLCLSESIISTVAFSPHLFQSYVPVHLPLHLFTWHSTLLLFVTGTYAKPY